VTAPKKSKHRKPDYSVPALDKALDLLETLAACTSPQPLSQLARLMDRTPSEVFRLLNCLQRRAYVVRDPVSGVYSLSLRLFELAHTHSPVEHILRVAAHPMRELADLVNESVHLSVVAHGHLVVLADVGSPYRIRFTHEVGARFSLVGTNSGRLLLAHLAPEALEHILRGDPEYASLDEAERDAFHAELSAIRRNRYAISASEERAGMKDIAVLAGNPAIGTTAALAIACLRNGKDKADANRLVAALWECAARITGELGLTYDRSAVF
jgi:DNA-binding IclR family transcriptional regulator